MLHYHARGEISRAKPHSKIDGGVAESVITQPRFEPGNRSISTSHHLARYLERDAFNLVKIATVIHPYIDGDREVILWQAEIRDHAARKFSVRHNHHDI